MLNYTGHPFFDVGVATLLAFAEKRDPTQLTPEDLEAVARYIEKEYVRQPLQSFLTVAFPNSGFTQPAFKKQPKKRTQYARKVAGSYSDELPTLDQQCVFTGEPATAVSYHQDDKLPLGRTFRQHIPLLTGEGVINFYPSNDLGLPVSGKALLAIQAMPLGCAKSGGRLLAIHSDNPIITRYFAREFFKENRNNIQLAQQSGDKKLAETGDYGYKTFLMSLLDAEEKQGDWLEDDLYASVTVYHFSNSGQGVDMKIYHLPSEVIGFLALMRSPKHQAKWSQIVYQAWERQPKDPKKAAKFERRRNYLYDDLFQLVTASDPFLEPHKVIRFVQTYFVRRAWRYDKQPETDPRQDYSLQTEFELVSWEIITEFLERILHMERTRIEAIRDVGERFAQYVQQHDNRFLNKLLWARRYSDISRILVIATTRLEGEHKRLREEEKAKREPFIRLQEYITLFEEGDGLAHQEWRLIRDLIVIRMIECLHDWGVKDLNITETDPNEPSEKTKGD